MFKKPFTAKPQTTLKNSDRKKLRNKLQEQYKLSDDDAKLLLPDVVSVMRIKTYNGENALIYSATSNDPLWIAIGKAEDEFIPSVYTLFKKPTLLPVITTWSFVIDKISTGADLMAPGVALKNDPNSLPHVQEGALVAVANHGANAAPVCVGRTAMPTSQMNLEATGKAVLITHSINDSLWLVGTQPKQIPDGHRQDVLFDSDSDSEIEDVQDVDTNADQSDSLPAQVEQLDVRDERDFQHVDLSAIDVDEMLRNALVHAISSSLQNAELPMQVSTLLSAHILPNRSSRIHPNLTELKNSSYKKATKFLKAMEKEDLLSFKEHKSNITITRINSLHPLVKQWRGHKTVAAAEKQNEKRTKQFEEEPCTNNHTKNVGYIVEDVYLAPKGVVREWLTTAGVKSDDYLTASQIRSIANSFIESNNLIHPADHAYVLGKNNEDFANMLYAKPSNQNKKSKVSFDDSDFIPRQEINGRIIQHMQPFTRLTQQDGSSRVIKGQLAHFKLQIKQRQGKKVTTHLSGPFKEFELKMDHLANSLKVICASSTTTSPMQNNPKELEVIVQGDKIRIVIDVLKTHGIPMRMIEIVPKK
ncbi:hypothetical protein E3P91_04081 [Wallemia ichthyophaga]|nr:hypothetical protein E3P91_04081 [Wallemia ichthyophaga]TIB58000.1 hypothetical protein E3P78_04069 [Wallemia ichthyophaga]